MPATKPKRVKELLKEIAGLAQDDSDDICELGWSLSEILEKAMLAIAFHDVVDLMRSSLALHLLDDDYGISEDAYNALMEAGMVPTDIANRVKATDGRFYLPSVSRDELERDFHE